MGINIISCCHKCKVKLFHYRGEENKTIIPFYKKHRLCMRENPNNVDNKNDQYQKETWMYDYPDGYKNDSLQKK